MAQAFVTTNGQTYIWHDYTNRTQSGKPPEAIYDKAPVSDIWIPSDESGAQTFNKASLDDLKKFVNILYKRRNWTTYQLHYCKKDLLKDVDEGNDEIAENELIENGKRIYSEPTQKILKPLPTARKVFGYIRPKNMYTGITEYQGIIGKQGYKILLKDYLACKKQKS